MPFIPTQSTNTSKDIVVGNVYACTMITSMLLYMCMCNGSYPPMLLSILIIYFLNGLASNHSHVLRDLDTIGWPNLGRSHSQVSLAIIA